MIDRLNINETNCPIVKVKLFYCYVCLMSNLLVVEDNIWYPYEL